MTTATINHDTGEIDETHAMTTMGNTPNLMQVRERFTSIQELMKGLMKPSVDYGTIPGCGPKPALLQPGAQKIGALFQLTPKISREAKTDLPGGHREYELTLQMIHAPTGTAWGDGVGTCSTMERKYRYRTAKPTCPECQMELRMSRDKPEWYCWQKQGGCGATFPKDQITGGGQVEHDNPADYFNTVRKMAFKRAAIHAILNSTGASEFFTQDIEEDPSLYGGQPQAHADTPPPPRQAARPQPAPARPAATQSNGHGNGNGNGHTHGHGNGRHAPRMATPAPQAQGDRDTIIATIQSVEADFKSGTNKKGRWSMSRVFTDSGDKFAIFSSDDARDTQRLQSLIDSAGTGQQVQLHIEQGKQGPLIREVELISDDYLPEDDQGPYVEDGHIRKDGSF